MQVGIDFQGCGHAVVVEIRRETHFFQGNPDGDRVLLEAEIIAG